MFYDTFTISMLKMKSLTKKKLYKKKNSKKEMSCDTNLIGMVTVWSKGQVVIPKEVREELNINEWDKLMVLTKHGMAVWLIKSDNVPEFLTYMQQEIDETVSIVV